MKPHICLLWTTPNQSCLAQICHWDIRTQWFTYIILAYLLWVFFWEGLLRQDVFFRETWCTALYTYNSEPHCALWTHRFNVQNHSQQQPAKYKTVLIENQCKLPILPLYRLGKSSLNYFLQCFDEWRTNNNIKVPKYFTRSQGRAQARLPLFIIYFWQKLKWLQTYKRCL